MPDSMYDRLGDMLSDVLESGTVFVGEDNKRTDDEQEQDARKEDVGRKEIPAEVKKALSFLGLEEDALIDDVKKAYHEKLKYYHPDRHGDNPVLQKVARNKTREVIEAWELLADFFEKET